MFYKAENDSSEFEYKYYVSVDVMSELSQYLDRLDDMIYYKYEVSPVPESLFVYIDGVTPADLCVIYNNIFDTDFDSLPSLSESDFYVDFDSNFDVMQDLIIKIWNCKTDCIRLT